MSGAGAGVGAAWSRHFLPGAGARADPIWSEPELFPEPWNSGASAGAAEKSGGSATLVSTLGGWGVGIVRKKSTSVSRAVDSDLHSIYLPDPGEKKLREKLKEKIQKKQSKL